MQHVLATILAFYNEDEEVWNAVALEMDIWGQGTTPEEAIEDLNELVRMQISFAYSMNSPQMIWHKAEAKYWKMLETARTVELRSHLDLPEDPFGIRKDKIRTSSVPFPSPQVIHKKNGNYKPYLTK